MANDCRILIAEDDENDRFLLDHAFRKAGVGIPVHFVEDGQEAVEYIESCSGPGAGPGGTAPELLLLDLKMPRLDGFQVLEWLRGNPVHREMVVIAFTSSSHPEDMKRARELGADAYAIKPNGLAGYVQFARGLEAQMAELRRARALVC